MLNENFKDIMEILQCVDAIEGYNGMEFGLTSFLSVEFANSLDKPMTAGSAGHNRGQYGKAFVKIHCGLEEVKEASTLISVIRNCKLSYGTNAE